MSPRLGWAFAPTLFFLAGCATLNFQPSWSVYRVNTHDPKKPEDDPVVFNLDRVYCQTVAEDYVSKISPPDVIVATGQGALSNSSSLNPIAIGAGAVGGAASSILGQSGLSVTDEREQFLDCVQRRTDADHSAFVPKQR